MTHDVSRNPLILGAMLTASGAPDDEAAWQDPAEPANASINPEWYRDIALRAEAARLDFLFVADAVFTDPDGPPHYLSRFEPLSLLSWLAAATRNIGLVGTFSTSYNEPYNLARKLMSLDHLSGGRTAWNLVTSLGNRAAQNFGRDEQYDHATRYARAEEFLSVVQGLWRSYSADAFPRHRASGCYLDKSKVQVLDHQGTFFSVKGPLNIERSPQGEPVIFQAGQSLQGQRLAAQSADVVFGMSTSIDEGLAYRASLGEFQKAMHLKRHGPLILQKLILEISDDDTSPAQAFRHYADRHQASRELRARVSRGIEINLANPATDTLPITDRIIDNAHANEGTWLSSALKKARDRGDSLGGALQQLLADKALVFAGSPAHIARQMEQWHDSGAADGFIIQISSQSGMAALAERLLPLLRQRGLYPRHYPTPSTLRQILRLVPEQGGVTVPTI